MSVLKHLGKIGASLTTAAIHAIERLANKGEYEALIAAVVLVAAADGTISTAERQAAVVAVSGHPALASFKVETTAKLFEEFLALLGADKESGQMALLEKISAVHDPVARTRIIGIATKIARADDGSVDENERKMIERIKAA